MNAAQSGGDGGKFDQTQAKLGGLDLWEVKVLKDLKASKTRTKCLGIYTYLPFLLNVSKHNIILEHYNLVVQLLSNIKTKIQFLTYQTLLFGITF